MKDVVLIKLNGNATLHVRKDKIIATVTGENCGMTDLYVDGVSLPWHIPSTVTSTDSILEMIWGDDE